MLPVAFVYELATRRVSLNNYESWVIEYSNVRPDESRPDVRKVVPLYAEPILAAGCAVVPEIASDGQRRVGFETVRGAVKSGARLEDAIVGVYEAMVHAADPPGVTIDKYVPPAGYRLVIDKPGEMFRIDKLIEYLQRVRAQFGTTHVYARDFAWGAVALDRQDADEAKTETD